MTDPTAQPKNDPFMGGLYMSLAMASFIVNDTLVKVVGQTVPTGQLLFVRGIMTIIIIGGIALVWGQARDMKLMFTSPVVMRAVTDLITTLLFITALLNLPLANANSILQAVPFTVIVLAWIFLGERVGWRRMSAVTVGFIGVLLIVKPGFSGFNAYSLFAVGAMFSVAARDILTRRIPTSTPSMVIALSNAMIVTAGGLVYASIEGFGPLDAQQLLLMFASAIMLSSAYIFMVLTVRTADVASTAPFRYTVSLWAVLAGYLVFGDIPDPFAFAGIGLIVMSGVYALRREAKLKKAAALPRMSPRRRW